MLFFGGELMLSKRIATAILALSVLSASNANALATFATLVFGAPSAVLLVLGAATLGTGTWAFIDMAESVNIQSKLTIQERHTLAGNAALKLIFGGIFLDAPAEGMVRLEAPSEEVARGAGLTPEEFLALKDPTNLGCINFALQGLYEEASKNPPPDMANVPKSYLSFLNEKFKRDLAEMSALPGSAEALGKVFKYAFLEQQ